AVACRKYAVSSLFGVAGEALCDCDRDQKAALPREPHSAHIGYASSLEARPDIGAAHIHVQLAIQVSLQAWVASDNWIVAVVDRINLQDGRGRAFRGVVTRPLAKRSFWTAFPVRRRDRAL